MKQQQDGTGQDQQNATIIREMAKLEILGAQQDGVRLGIKFGAKSLRDIADECAKDSSIAPDYIRGLRDAAVFIERFAADVEATK